MDTRLVVVYRERKYSDGSRSLRDMIGKWDVIFLLVRCSYLSLPRAGFSHLPSPWDFSILPRLQ